MLFFLSQIPITQSSVMDDIEKWLELDDEVSANCEMIFVHSFKQYFKVK